MSCWRPSSAAKRRWREATIKRRRSNRRRRPATNRLLYTPRDLIPTKLNFRLSLRRKTSPNLLICHPRRNPKAIRKILITPRLCSSSNLEAEATPFLHHPLPLPKEALQPFLTCPHLLRPLLSTSTFPVYQNRLYPRPHPHPLSTFHLPTNQHYHLLLPPSHLHHRFCPLPLSQVLIFPHHLFPL